MDEKTNYSAEISSLRASLAESQAALCKTWKVSLTCCGRDSGEEFFPSWEEANKFREDYTSGVAVNEHGYSAHQSESGHRRSAVVSKAPCPHEAEANRMQDFFGAARRPERRGDR